MSSKSSAATNGLGVPQTSKSGSSNRSNQNRTDLDTNQSDKGRGRRNSNDEKSRSAKERDESRRRAKYEAKNSDPAKSTPSAPSKRKNVEVISPTGLTPPAEKAKTSGTCTFNNFYRLKLSPSQRFCDRFFESGFCDNMIGHGKAKRFLSKQGY